ncbi:olfactory receptor 8D1-like [Gastrophryne carolinensis]
MENHTVVEFQILPFFLKTDHDVYIYSFVLFFFLYLFGILTNASIITVIFLTPPLHTPLYLFLANLSVVDVCYTTVTVPKLLYILLSGDNTVTFRQCLTQMYFSFITASTEPMNLMIMAYDRYVAICHPLYYNSILTKNICILIVMAMWVFACLNAFILTNAIMRIIFCSSVTIHQFFCDAKPLINISCGGTDMFYVVFYAECLILGFCPTVCNVISYVNIMKVVLHLKSKDGRSKAFSTCSSHLTVMAIYYGSGVTSYMMPPSDHSFVLEQVLAVFYTAVVPTLNPLIYTLRNKEVKTSLQKLRV